MKWGYLDGAKINLGDPGALRGDDCASEFGIWSQKLDDLMGRYVGRGRWNKQ